MADDFQVADVNNTTKTIGMDDISSVLYQRVKSGFGPDGSYTDVSLGAGLPTAQQYEEVAGSAAANNTDLVASKDVRAYRTVTFQLSGTWVATVSAQVSNDNTTWTTVATFDVSNLISGIASGTTAYTTTRAVNGLFVVTLLGTRYFRLRTTAYTSGTVVSTTEFSSNTVWWLSSAVSTNNQSIPTSGPVYGYSLPADGEANASTVGTGGNLKLYNGTANNTWDRGRTATKFASIGATSSGDTAVYTPTSGKKFRILRYSIECTADVATSGGSVIDIVLRDSSTALGFGSSIFAPAVAGTTFGAGHSTGWRDVSNGYQSTTINNVLNVNLSATLTSGKVRVNVALCEE